MNDYTTSFNITGGQIRGYYDAKNDINIFKGIPFGRLSLENRFKEPVEPEPWEGIRDCLEFGPSPVQQPLDHSLDNLFTEEFIISNRDMDEDCLNLNIWAPARGQNHSVVLYFYGGGFCGGGSSCEIYDGTSFAKNDVIYITFNHRVGNLSLFTHEDLDAKSKTGYSGNCNLMDAIYALKWIQRNIASFGGDTNKVTIWGQSSGAAEVQALSVCEKGKGLFSQVISMGYNSYTAFSRPWFDKGKNEELSSQILKDLNLSLDEYISSKTDTFIKGNVLQNLVIDGHFIRQGMRDSVLNGDSNWNNQLIGAVPGDYLLGNIFGSFRAPEKESIKALIEDKFSGDSSALFTLYDFDNKEAADLFEEINNDNLIACQLYYAKARKKAGAKKTYSYFFTHVMPGPYSNMYGAFHSSEVPYFTNIFSEKRKDYWTPLDKKLGNIMNDELAFFIKNGNFKSVSLNVDDELQYILIDDAGFKIATFPEEKFALWEKYYDSLARN